MLPQQLPTFRSKGPRRSVYRDDECQRCQQRPKSSHNFLEVTPMHGTSWESRWWIAGEIYTSETKNRTLCIWGLRINLPKSHMTSKMQRYSEKMFPFQLEKKSSSFIRLFMGDGFHQIVISRITLMMVHWKMGCLHQDVFSIFGHFAQNHDHGKWEAGLCRIEGQTYGFVMTIETTMM